MMLNTQSTIDIVDGDGRVVFFKFDFGRSLLITLSCGLTAPERSSRVGLCALGTSHYSCRALAGLFN